MDSVTDRPEIHIRRYEAGDARLWKDFLEKSNNGTLFHDLDFLAYHPEKKFECQHLLFYHEKELIALLPAAIVEPSPGRRILQSPYGASVGGFVIPSRLKVSLALEMVRALQSYVQREGLAGIEFRLAPNSYMREPNDLIPFVLQVCGFSLVHSSLVFMVPLDGPKEDMVDRRLSATKRKNVRSNLRKGVLAREVDESRLDDFYAILLDNWARHNAVPTHSHDDLVKLFKLVPGKLRLFLCRHQEVEIAGVLVFILNEKIANTFYMCERQDTKDEFRGPAVLNAHLMEQMTGEGFRYLDLGPSISDTHYNQGAVFFKEGMGAEGFSRQTWSWKNPSVS